jgi:hypothetical protein
VVSDLTNHMEGVWDKRALEKLLEKYFFIQGTSFIKLPFMKHCEIIIQKSKES